MTLNQNTHKDQFVFWYSYWHERQFHCWHCTQTCSYDTIGLCNLLSSSSTQCLRSFISLQSFLCIVFWSYFFPCKVEQPLVIYHSIDAHAAMTLGASTEHYQVQLSVPIFCRLDHSRFVNLKLANTCEDGSTILQHKMPTFKPSILAFHSNFQLVWNKFCFCCSLKYFLLLHNKASHLAGYFIAYISPMNFERRCQEPWYSSITLSLYICEEHFLNNMLLLSTCHHICSTQPPSSNCCNVCIHAAAFNLGSIHTASCKPLQWLSHTSASSYSRRCTHTEATGRHVKEAEGPMRRLPLFPNAREIFCKLLEKSSIDRKIL